MMQVSELTCGCPVQDHTSLFQRDHIPLTGTQRALPHCQLERNGNKMRYCISLEAYKSLVLREVAK